MAADMKTAIEMARGVVDETMPHHWSEYDVIVAEAEFKDTTIRWWHLYESTGYPFSVAKIDDETCRIAWQWGEETVRMSIEDVVENPDIALSEASNKATWGK